MPVTGFPTPPLRKLAVAGMPVTGFPTPPDVLGRHRHGGDKCERLDDRRPGVRGGGVGGASSLAAFSAFCRDIKTVSVARSDLSVNHGVLGGTNFENLDNTLSGRRTYSWCKN